MRLYTKISEASWCDSTGNFKSAKMPSMKIWDTGPEKVYWLDKLFEGGIFIPKELQEEKRALTILLTGPPGTGKSTLAMQLCFNLTSTHVINEISGAEKVLDDDGFSSIYITSESNETWDLQKAESFGWITQKDISTNIINNQDIFSDKRVVKIWQTTEFLEYLQDEEKLSGITPTLLDAFCGFFGLNVQLSPLANAIKKKWDKHLKINKIKKHDPCVLAIDSLNTFEEKKRPEIFNRFMSLVNSGPMILLLVVEAGTDRAGSEFWEYASDIVIRLDKTIISDYLIRTIEIVKARYQSHIWGPHQLKIYTPSVFEQLPEVHPQMTDEERRRFEEIEKRIIDKKKRAHPYHESGGIFIFPSIHYYLSVYKRMSPISQYTDYEPPLETLSHTFTQGFPRGRCIGFIGIRGGHKSHLGYLTILKKITENPNERALIISLRDDEGMARKTLTKILRYETKSKYQLDNLIKEDKLEIMYSPPGHITPEEFFHRMLLSILRLKNHDVMTNVTVLFNSLDQLSSRFPLCARQQIFIPGIISALSAEGVTSIFIAVEEPGQPPEQYGLLSMADALISFKHEKLHINDYWGHIMDCKSLKVDEDNDKIFHAKKELPETQQIVCMKIVRFSGGQAAGAGGMLELIHKDTEKAVIFHDILSTDTKDVGSREGLVFIPFSRHYTHETRLTGTDTKNRFEKTEEAYQRI